MWNCKFSKYRFQHLNKSNYLLKHCTSLSYWKQFSSFLVRLKLVNVDSESISADSLEISSAESLEAGYSNVIHSRSELILIHSKCEHWFIQSQISLIHSKSDRGDLLEDDKTIRDDYWISQYSSDFKSVLSLKISSSGAKFLSPLIYSLLQIYY